uniref:Uncharacterized protein n=1 Tax=Anguilla anguilla TaxID=7936 RepID=A0A0E9R0P9_ANGAN
MPPAAVEKHMQRQLSMDFTVKITVDFSRATGRHKVLCNFELHGAQINCHDCQ